MNFKITRKYLLTGCLAIAVHLLTSAQESKPFSASFIGTLGGDTVLVETYTMINNHLYGKAFIRVPEDYVGEFSIHFYPDGSIREFNMEAMDPSNSSIPFKAVTNAFEYRINMNCANDSCTFYNSLRNSSSEIVLKHRAGAVDFVGGWVPVVSLIEWNCLRLAKSHGRILPLKMVNHYLGVYPIDVHYLSKVVNDTIIFGGPFLEYTKVMTSADGRIKAVDGTGTPWNYHVTRHDPIDIDQVAKRMTKTKGIGLPSPEENIATAIKDSKIELHYGRPLKRGRKIFGGIVPYDSVWRTGAGAPTTISLSNDIKIGQTTIPKGKYSLYTVPRKNDWTLIFNRDLKTWPTNPNTAGNLAEVTIPVTKVDTVKEQFTIEIAETKKGGVLRFQWDDVTAQAQFQIAGNK